MELPIAIVAFLVIAGLTAAIGFRIGILLTPRVERWSHREEGDDDRTS